MPPELDHGICGGHSIRIGARLAQMPVTRKPDLTDGVRLQAVKLSGSGYGNQATHW